jgi:hypothetical protein
MTIANMFPNAGVRASLMLLGLFVFKNAFATDLPTSCAPVSLVSAPAAFGQPTTVQVTNQCGACANISFNVYNNGSPQQFAATHSHMAPGEARKIVFTATKLGTTEVKVVKVMSLYTTSLSRHDSEKARLLSMT